MATYTIRKAKLSDAKLLTSITAELNWFQPDSSKFDPLKIKEDILNRFRNHIKQADGHIYSLYVAESFNNNIIGYSAVYWLKQLYLSDEEGFVTDLFVSSTVQNRGIATLLLEKIKQEATIRGCSRLILQTNKNKPVYLKGFYLKRGWIESIATATFIYELRDSN